MNKENEYMKKSILATTENAIDQIDNIKDWKWLSVSIKNSKGDEKVFKVKLLTLTQYNKTNSN